MPSRRHNLVLRENNKIAAIAVFPSCTRIRVTFLCVLLIEQLVCRIVVRAFLFRCAMQFGDSFVQSLYREIHSPVKMTEGT